MAHRDQDRQARCAQRAVRCPEQGHGQGRLVADVGGGIQRTLARLGRAAERSHGLGPPLGVRDQHHGRSAPRRGCSHWPLVMMMGEEEMVNASAVGCMHGWVGHGGERERIKNEEEEEEEEEKEAEEDDDDDDEKMNERKKKETTNEKSTRNQAYLAVSKCKEQRSTGSAAAPAAHPHAWAVFCSLFSVQ